MSKTYAEETVIQKVVDVITCNKCGDTNFNDTGTEKKDMVSIQYSFSFNSKHDCETWSFDLCEPCFEEFCSTFKVPVEVTEWM